MPARSGSLELLVGCDRPLAGEAAATRSAAVVERNEGDPAASLASAFAGPPVEEEVPDRSQEIGAEAPARELRPAEGSRLYDAQEERLRRRLPRRPQRAPAGGPIDTPATSSVAQLAQCRRSLPLGSRTQRRHRHRTLTAAGVRPDPAGGGQIPLPYQEPIDDPAAAGWILALRGILARWALTVKGLIQLTRERRHLRWLRQRTSPRRPILRNRRPGRRPIALEDTRAPVCTEAGHSRGGAAAS